MDNFEPYIEYWLWKTPLEEVEDVYSRAGDIIAIRKMEREKNGA